MKKDEVAQRLAKPGIVPGGMSQDQIEAMFQREHETFAELIKAMSIEKSN